MRAVRVPALPALPKSDPRISTDRPNPGSSAKRQVLCGLLAMRREASEKAEQVNELRFGEGFTVYEEKDGWAWGQSARDDYVGFVRAEGLSKNLFKPTHRVSNLFTFIFSEPSVKAPVVERITFLSPVAVGGEKDRFYVLESGGFVHRDHLAPIGQPLAKDPVAVAERLMDVPYLWGGVSPLGCDCSGLIQLALEACGLSCPRDSDMQAESLGHVVDQNKLQRGDIVCFKGHIGFMADGTNLLHANAWHGRVVIEPLADVVARGSQVITVRRF